MVSLVFGYATLKIGVGFLFHHRPLLTTSYVQVLREAQINKTRSLTLTGSQLSVKEGRVNRCLTRLPFIELLWCAGPSGQLFTL